MTQFRFQKSQDHPRAIGTPQGKSRIGMFGISVFWPSVFHPDMISTWIYPLQLLLLAIFFESGTEIQSGSRNVLATFTTARVLSSFKQAHTHACMLAYMHHSKTNSLLWVFLYRFNLDSISLSWSSLAQSSYLSTSCAEIIAIRYLA